jgi:hypothetical protein
MRTTLVIDDHLYRKAKIAAASAGITLTSLVEQALSLKLNEVLPGEAGVLEDLTFLDFLGEPKVDIDLSNNSEVLDLLDSE